MFTTDVHLPIPDRKYEGSGNRVTNVLEPLNRMGAAEFSLEGRTADMKLSGDMPTVDDLTVTRLARPVCAMVAMGASVTAIFLTRDLHRLHLSIA